MEITVKKKTLKLVGFLSIIALSLFVLNGYMEDKVANQGDTVKVDYWLEVEGEQIDTSEGRGLFEFKLGAGQVIPGFDNAVTGMKVGEEKSIELSGADAYTQGPLAGKTLKFRLILRAVE